ncbi:calcium-binding protein [Pseudaestuariivita rosea]|uniref:calcium-binding protein n=1 Tax=Pseudaestuariivita rosea TaxID=2763263 RepID=UPI001ABB1EDC|nr:calcium-binding protein [Pseudaestuariivita rosea]
MFGILGLVGIFAAGTAAMVMSVNPDDVEDDQSSDEPQAPDEEMDIVGSIDELIATGEARESLTETHGGQDGDLIYGSESDDAVDGADGDDSIFGYEGDDLIYAGDGDDFVAGNQGDDMLAGAAGNDELHGGEGEDTIFGGSGADVLAGSTGDDALSGGTGNDLLLGQEGDDTLIGDAGVDTLDGGIGDDTLILGRSDTGTGGLGRDHFVLDAGQDQDGDVARLSDYSAGEDQITVVYDETQGEPQITLADSIHEDGATDIILNGTVIASVLGNDVSIDDITLVAQSQMDTSAGSLMS